MAELSSISSDGRTVAFVSDATNLVEGDTNAMDDVFVHDIDSGRTSRESLTWEGAQVSGGSASPWSGSDGRFVAFASDGADVVAGDSNGSEDVFLRDRERGTVSRVSVAADGSEASGRSYYPVMSAGAEAVVFVSEAAGLVPGDTNDRTDMFVGSGRH